jgi:arylsulfatase K
MAGEQNQVLKRCMYEASSHVPLIIAGPDVRRGAVVDTPVSLVDLYPTLMDMAGIDYDSLAARSGYADVLDGESLMPQLANGTPRQRDWAMAEYHGDRACTGTFMLRQDRWKLIRHMGFDSELYDVEADPGEQNDLGLVHSDVAARLEGVLDAHFDCAGIDARAKDYDCASFVRWRAMAKADGFYEETMSHVFSGYDRQSIEELELWTAADEERIDAWLARALPRLASI